MIHMNRALHASLHDATSVMIHHTQPALDSDDGPNQSIRIDHNRAIKQFFHSMSMHISDFETRLGLEYIPFLVFIEDDGFIIATLETYLDDANLSVRRHELLPKRYFSSVDLFGNSFLFTLNDHFKIRLHNQKKWYIGSRSLLFQQTKLSKLSIASRFEIWKRNSILSQIERELSRLMNNEFQFVFPRNPKSGQLDSEMANVLDDIGMIAAMFSVHPATTFHPALKSRSSKSLMIATSRMKMISD